MLESAVTAMLIGIVLGAAIMFNSSVFIATAVITFSFALFVRLDAIVTALNRRV